ncbi:hypothetical protein Tco_1321827, partial [Tanacetum coccineum]
KGSNPALSISKMKAASYPYFGLELLVPEQMWIDDVCTYDIKKDFKNLYPSDFEDLNLLLLEGHLDHLPGSDKRMLSTPVKLWTQNLVIRQRVEEFQLGIESYQTQLNLTKLGWDATGYEFKHDYTIIESPRAVVFPSQGIQGQAAQSGYEYTILDSKGCDKEILLKMNLPDHSIKVKGTSRMMNDQVFTIKKSMSMPVQLSQTQDGERPQVDDQRFDLADDLKEAQVHISSTITSHKTKITTSMYKISHEESMTTS